MKIIRINHVGLVPKSASKCSNFFKDILNLEHRGEENVEEQHVHVNMFAAENSNLEILEPTADISPIAQFLQKKGSGIHHLAFEVDDIDAWLKYLKEKNVELIDEKTKNGAHDTKVAFIHPRATGGILIELVQT